MEPFEPLSTDLVNAELKRAADISEGRPAKPGQDRSVKFTDTFKFSDYHEPLQRWPYVSDPLLEKLRKHGRQPPLLTDQGRTKGVPNQRQYLHSSPSDRIGGNMTPSAKHLRIRNLREERIRRARLRQLMRLEALARQKPLDDGDAKPKSSYKQAPYVKFNKLVSRPPKGPR
jgi:hypothetical protein